ncbi:Golgi transport complex subunit 3, partial [Perkinsus olseni]
MAALDDQGASKGHQLGKGQRPKEDYSKLSSDQQRVLDDITAHWAERHADDISRCNYWMTDDHRKRLARTEDDDENCATSRDVYGKFYAIYAHLETQQESKEDSAVRERWKWAMDIRDACDNINESLRDSVALLDEVDSEREQVVDKTT